MGKTILTPKQSHFLELASADPFVKKTFYLTGGTALAEFHLHHRLSEDIDLFSETAEVDPATALAFLKKRAPLLGIKKVHQSQFLGLVSFHLTYTDGETLKVDFNYYPFPRIEPGLLYKGLSIDSIRDIAANKVHTLFVKPRSRDYIDLYYIFQTQHFTIKNLIIDAKTKFDWHIDPVTLASQFSRVTDLKEFPTMLIPFDRNELNTFFLDQAKALKKDIFRL